MFIYSLELNEDRLPVLVKEKEIAFLDKKLDNKEGVMDFFNIEFKLTKKAEEMVYMMALNTKCHPIGVFEISHGTLNASLLSPREVMIRALLVGACSMIIVHNHPSGEPGPSADDFKIYRYLKDAGTLIGIKLLDFIIVGKDKCFSYND